MKRRTKDPRLALERLAEHGNKEVRKVDHGYVLFHRDPRGNIRFSPGSTPLSAKRSLAHLVYVAQWGHKCGGLSMTRAEVRDVIRLTRITSHGLVAHQEQTIREVLSV